MILRLIVMILGRAIGPIGYVLTASATSTKICGSFTEDGFLSHSPNGTVCFTRYEIQLNWWEAQERCVEEGGSLAKITNQNIDRFIDTHVYNTHSLWIAGIHETNKGWKWADGEDMTYTNFDSLAVSWTRTFSFITRKSLCTLFWKYGWEKKDCKHSAQFVCHSPKGKSALTTEADELKERTTFAAPKTTPLTQIHHHQKLERTFKALKVVEGRLNPKLSHCGRTSTETSSLMACVRECSAAEECILINFCKQTGQCVFYDNFDSPLNAGATSEKGCFVYADMDKYNIQ